MPTMHILPLVLVACNCPSRYSCYRLPAFSIPSFVVSKKPGKDRETSDLNLPECTGSAPLFVAQRPIEFVPRGGDLVDRGLGREGGGRAEDGSEAGSLHLGKQFDTAEWRPTYAETGPHAGVYFWIVKMMKCSWSCRRQPPATHCATLASLGFQRGDNQAKS